jgi:hypothetical protein
MGIARVKCGNCYAAGPYYAIRRKVGGKVWATDAAAHAWNGNPPKDTE